MSRHRSPPSTERIHPRAETLDRLPLSRIVRRLHAEDLSAVRAVGRSLRQIEALAQRACEALGHGGRLIYVGAGTSGRLAALDAAECPPTFGISPDRVVAVIAGGPKALAQAVEGAEDDPRAAARAISALRVSQDDLVIGISASATTPFVLGALAAARRRKAKTALVCHSQPPVPPKVDELVVVETGPELVAGSTRLKAGTATKLVLNAVSTSALASLGHVYRGRMIDLRPTNAKLVSRATRMLVELGPMSEARARALLREAKGSTKVALAMHWTGLTAERARKLLDARGLRALEPR